MYENQMEAVIKQRMLDAIPDTVSKAEGALINDSIAPDAIELNLAYQELDKVLARGFAETSYGEWLRKKVFEVGMTPKDATEGSGQIEVTMSVGSTISIGNILATQAGNIRFIATENKTIGVTGKELIAFKNETVGNFGNILADTVFTTPVSINGFISAKNLVQINAGTNAETDAELLVRYSEHVQTPSVSGNKQQYKNWAKEISGIGDAYILPRWAGPDTIKIFLIDSNKQPASQDLIDAVQSHIDPLSSGDGEGKAPVDHFVTAAAAVAVEIDISVTVVKDTDHTIQQIKDAFEATITEYLKGIAFSSDTTVRITRVGNYLLDIAGVLDYSNLTLNSTSANITVSAGEVAVLGTVTLNE